MSDDFFIGWAAKPPARDRRFLLAAAAGFVVGAGALGGSLGRRGLAPGPGAWNQADVRTWTGLLVRAPYPMLLMPYGRGVRTALLATTGKRGVATRIPDGLSGVVTVRASAIARGAGLMLAVVDGADWISPSDTAAPAIPAPTDLGEVALAGEILDAKCWLGAMRPGFGKTHKSCAALCAEGGLPLAFCTAGSCGDALSAPLFVDTDGNAHAPAIRPLVADPVLAVGRLVRFGDLTTFRVAPTAIRRL